MIEIPEAANLAQEMRTSLVGRRIVRAAAAASPHRFAFYYGDPAQYAPQLEGRRIDGASSFGGFAQLHIGQTRLAVSDGANLRLYGPGEKHPAKHQLHIELDDGYSLLFTIQMYGGIWVFPEGGMRDNEYLQGARAKPSPLSEAFDEAYFDSLRRSLCAPFCLAALIWALAVPAAASLEYPIAFRSMTSGKGSYYSEFYRYQECPLELGATARRRGIHPLLERSKWILHARSAL